MPVLKLVPSVEPLVSVPDNFQRLRADASAFGAQTGQGLESLSRAFGQAGDKLADVALERQTLHNQTVVDDLTNQWMEQVNKRMRGDPDLPGDLGFMGLKGSNAMSGFAVARKDIDKGLQDIQSKLQNPVQQHLFNQVTRRQRAIYFDEMGRHYDRESQTYAVNTAEATQKLAQINMVATAAADDFGGFQEFVTRKMQGALKEVQLRGGGPEQEALAKRSVEADAVKTWVRSRGATDPEGALRFLDAHKDMVGEEYPALKDHLRTRAVEGAVNRELFGVGPAPGSNRLVRGGALSAASHYGYLVSQGATPNEAALLTSAADAESGFNPDSSHDADILAARGLGPGYGLYGHNAERLAAMRREAGSDKPTWEQQAKFALNELRSRPEGRLVNSVKTPEELTELQFQFERPRRGPGDGTAKRLASTREFMRNPPAAVSVVQNAASITPAVIPPRDENELPDNEVPWTADKKATTLEQRLQQLAEKYKDQPDLLNAMVKRARQEANRQYIDQQHALTRARQQREETNEVAMRNYEKRMTSDSPNFPTSDEIDKDPNLTSTGVRNMQGYLASKLKGEAPSHVSATNQADIYRRIHLPDDNEGKIRDRQPIRDAYIKGEINTSARNDLMKDFDSLYNEKEKDVAKAEADVFDIAEGKIIPERSFLPKNLAYAANPTQAEKVVQWKRDVTRKVQEYQAANKSVMDLFTPGNPAYVGGGDFIKRYEATLPDKLKDKPKESSGSFFGSRSSGGPTLDLTTKEGVIKAYRQDKLIDYRQAAEALRKLGIPAGMPDNTTPAPPMAR